ncbi:hypothetical protein CRG98_038440 [Punica granatum]|uniref:CBM-cenC domain-containing protein n=1 Tax=Punica granatum TaxID=22663 RepID=A0A2I0IAX1_PUNGR|nr:hypothetical protein CRG98_038440 [Punica granatum]
MDGTCICFLSTFLGKTHGNQISRTQGYWHPNFSHGYVVNSVHDYPERISLKSAGRFAVLTNRKWTWHCLEQNITSGIIQGACYMLAAFVDIAGRVQGLAEVLASLKIDYEGSNTTHYVNIGNDYTCFKVYVSKDEWEDLQGSSLISNKPSHVVLYIEGPPAGIDLLIEYVKVTKSTHHVLDGFPDPSVAENIISNPLFDAGLAYWSARGCQMELGDSTISDTILPLYGRFFVKSTRSKLKSSGIQPDVIGRLWRKIPYQLTAVMQISGSGGKVIYADVRATLRIKTMDGSLQHVPIAKSVSS